MILRSLTVAGWRSILEPVTLGPLPGGITVIHAPNGTGKSTLFEALRRGLLDSHTVGGEGIKAIQPWGRPLSPAVTIEFVHGGDGYRLEKSFLDGAASHLYRHENGRFTRFASGRTADDQVRTMLTRNPPGRGLAQQRNWGLAQALWAPQGDLRLDGLSEDLVSGVQQMLGAQLSNEATSPVERRIADVYALYFTSTGKLKGGANAPEIVHLERQREAAQAVFQTAQEQLLVFEDLSRKVEDCRARRLQASHVAEELTAVIGKARAEAREFDRIRAEADQKKETVGRAQAEYERLTQHIELIQDTEAEKDRLQEALEQLSQDVPNRRRNVETLEKEHAEAQHALDQVKHASAQIEKRQDAVDAARRYTETWGYRNSLAKRIARIETAEQELADARSQAAGLVAPDKKILSTIRKVREARKQAQQQIEAALISVEVVPLQDGGLDVLVAEEPGSIPLTSGRPVNIQGTPEVVTELKGVARIRASGPTADVEAHRKIVKSGNEQMRSLCEPFGTEDLSRLEELCDEALRRSAIVDKAGYELATLLDGDSLDGLRQEMEKADRILTSIGETYPDWKATPPDPEALGAELQEERRGLYQRWDTAEEHHTRSQLLLSNARELENALTKDLETKQEALRRLEVRLQHLQKDQPTREESEEQRKERLMTWKAERALLETLEEQLARFDGNPADVLNRLEREQEAARATADAARDEEKQQEGRLASLEANGAYSVCAEAEEEAARLDEAVQRERVRVEGIRLLYTTLEACRAEAVSKVAEPVERSATRLLQRIAGRRIGDVHLDDAFTPSHVVPGTASSEVTIENLSGGETEQLYLATRLALAAVLAEEERQLVVFDDVLTATDTGRLARIQSVLQEEAQRLQILILTCHPERYRGLDTAQFIDLETLITASLQ